MAQPDDRAAAFECPECGVSLEGMDLQGHAYHHWGEQRNLIPGAHDEAIRRRDLLVNAKKPTPAPQEAETPANDPALTPATEQPIKEGE